MKKTLILLLFVIVANSIYSQDLIVTNDGDSINCKITKVKTDNIYFTFKHKNEVRSTLLPVSSVKEHLFDFYQLSEVPKDKVIGYENYPHLRIAVSGGYSYMTAKVAETVPSDFKNYVKELKSGYHLGGDITYYFSEIFGAGGKYFVFKSSNSMDNIYAENLVTGEITYGNMSDDLTTSFIGPMFSSRFLNHNKKNAFLMNASLGYLGYSNDKIFIDKYKITGGTMGMSLDLGYDIEFSEKLSLGFQLSFVSGTLFEYNVNDGVKTEKIKLNTGEYESLSRIDFSIGLRFNN